MGDFDFYQSHFLVKYLYFYSSMVFEYFKQHWMHEHWGLDRVNTQANLFLSRFFISAPNVFHLGVKEKVFVQMGGSLLNRPLTLYLEAEHYQGRLMSDRVSTSCSSEREIKTVELMVSETHIIWTQITHSVENM